MVNDWGTPRVDELRQKLRLEGPPELWALARSLEQQCQEWRDLFSDTSEKLVKDRHLWGLAVKGEDDAVRALEDIANCRIPGIPDGATVSVEQFAAFARQRAKEALIEPAAKTLHST